MGGTETENELGFLFQTEGNMLGYIPGQNLTLDEPLRREAVKIFLIS